MTFLKLTLAADRTPYHVAADEISRFMPSDKYRPSEGSLVVLKDGGQYRVLESTDDIALRLS